MCSSLFSSTSDRSGFRFTHILHWKWPISDKTLNFQSVGAITEKYSNENVKKRTMPFIAQNLSDCARELSNISQIGFIQSESDTVPLHLVCVSSLIPHHGNHDKRNACDNKIYAGMNLQWVNCKFIPASMDSVVLPCPQCVMNALSRGSSKSIGQ